MFSELPNFSDFSDKTIQDYGKTMMTKTMLDFIGEEIDASEYEHQVGIENLVFMLSTNY